MGAARSSFLGRHTRPGGLRMAALGAASALALLASACVTGPSPEEIHQMDWQAASRMDTPPAYANYMRMYPDGPFVSVARTRMDELVQVEADAFAVARRDGSEKAFADFLGRYPWGRHAAEADLARTKAAAPRLAAEERAEWDDVKRRDIIDAYETFLTRWPASSHAGEARSRLDALWRTDQGAFVRAKRSGSPDQLEDFVRAYPRSVYVADARRELDAMRVRDGEAWRVALRENNVGAYDFYLANQPWGSYRNDATRAIQALRDKDYDAWLYARRVDEIWAYENYRSMYPWGYWYDTAFYRIGWINTGRYDRNWNRDWDYDRDDWDRDRGRRPPRRDGDGSWGPQWGGAPDNTNNNNNRGGNNGGGGSAATPPNPPNPRPRLLHNHHPRLRGMEAGAAGSGATAILAIGADRRRRLHRRLRRRRHRFDRRQLQLHHRLHHHPHLHHRRLYRVRSPFQSPVALRGTAGPSATRRARTRRSSGAPDPHLREARLAVGFSGGRRLPGEGSWTLRPHRAGASCATWRRLPWLSHSLQQALRRHSHSAASTPR